MDIIQFKSIIENVVKQTEELIKENKRGMILNERFFHHMFSNRVASFYSQNKINIWDSLMLIPEAPTREIFLWEELKLSDEFYSRENAIGKGKCGNFDFIIQDGVSLLIEWKGPKSYTKEDIAKVMLKLFAKTKTSDVKIFCAIITDAKKGGKKHIDTLNKYLNEGIEFVSKVLDTRIDDTNLHLFIVTIPNSGRVTIAWDHLDNGNR